MSKKKARYFNEPWSASKSTVWQLGFKSGPPTFAATPEELQERIAAWHINRDAAEAKADWLVWASKLSEPDITVNLNGTIGAWDDKRILTFTKMMGLPEGSPEPQEYAERAASCVNACRGLADPEQWMRDCQQFLLDMMSDPIDTFFNSRATRLLAKCTNPEDRRDAEDVYDD